MRWAVCKFIKSRTKESHGHEAQITDGVLLRGGIYWSMRTTNSPVLLLLHSSSLNPAAGTTQALLETRVGLIFHCCVLRRMEHCSQNIVEYWFTGRSPLSGLRAELYGCYSRSIVSTLSCLLECMCLRSSETVRRLLFHKSTHVHIRDFSIKC